MAHPVRSLLGGALIAAAAIAPIAHAGIANAPGAKLVSAGSVNVVWAADPSTGTQIATFTLRGLFVSNGYSAVSVASGTYVVSPGNASLTLTGRNVSAACVFADGPPPFRLNGILPMNCTVSVDGGVGTPEVFDQVISLSVAAGHNAWRAAGAFEATDTTGLTGPGPESVGTYTWSTNKLGSTT